MSESVRGHISDKLVSIEMPPRRGRSSKAKTSAARDASPAPPPTSSSTAAGWESEDDLLADDKTISAVSAFPGISNVSCAIVVERMSAFSYEGV